MTMPEMRRTTKHTPVVRIGYDRDLGRDKARLMSGENRCKAPPYPGCTTVIDSNVTCEACLVLLREAK